MGVPVIRRLGDEELAPDVRARLEAKVARLGYVGEFFKVAGHQPEALCAFIDLTESLKHALPDEITEVVALTAASELGNDYERHQHERLSVNLGLSPDWVAAASGRATGGDAGASPLSDAQRAVRDLTLAMLARKGHDVDAELDAVVAAIGQERAVGVLLLVGRYVAHALIANAARLTPPVPSIFAEA